MLGQEAEQRQDWAAALPHYERAAREATTVMPMLRDEALRGALPPLARTFMALDRLPEAESVMLIWAALPPTPPPKHDGMGFEQAMQALGAAFQIAQEGARAMNQRLVVEGESSDKVEAVLAFRVPATRVQTVMWAELRARQGKHEEVRRLWQQEFPAYLQTMFKHEDRTRRMLINEEASVAAWRMGLALQAGGSFDEAQKALELALGLNRERLQHLSEGMPAVETQLGGFQQQRWIAVSALQLAMQSGAPAHQRFALGALASAKGLTNRFLQHRRALLSVIDERSPRGTRAKLDAMDAKLVQMPTEGDEGMLAWSDWVNARAELMTPVMPALAKAGLANVIADGSALLDKIERSLQPGEALIGYLQYQPVDLLKAGPAPWRYLRYTLVGGQVTIQDLGPKRERDQAIAAFRRADNPEHQHASARALAATLLGQLPAGVATAQRWVIDPDGFVALLPFEALPDEGNALVLDKHSVRYLSSLAQLADQDSRALPAPRQGALILADARYPDVGSGKKVATGLPMILAQGQAWRDMKFQPLPETRAEAAAVSETLRKMGISSQTLLGADATPDALRKLDAPAFVHVASHGFLLSPSPEADGQARNRARIMVPGLLAGLMLSEGRRGPVFTGTDLAALNLRGTRLVVLSACDTGNGSFDAHEGLSSLRRAVEEAGARASLTSLWPVPSLATTRLMTQFYAELGAGKSNAEALRLAKLSVKSGGGSLRDWAGFVLAGAER